MTETIVGTINYGILNLFLVRKKMVLLFIVQKKEERQAVWSRQGVSLLIQDNGIISSNKLGITGFH